MKKNVLMLVALFLMATQLQAQVEPAAGNWKTWFIPSGKTYRLPPPASYKEEISQVLSQQKNLDAAGEQQIIYWNAGAPGYRWQELISKVWMTDSSYNGVLVNMLLGVATYDATIAAWDTKYAYDRPPPVCGRQSNQDFYAKTGKSFLSLRALRSCGRSGDAYFPFLSFVGRFGPSHGQAAHGIADCRRRCLSERHPGGF